MILALIVVFILGYLLITLEHTIKLNKTATALLTGVLVWTIYAVFNPPASILESSVYQQFLASHADVKDPYVHFVGENLSHHLSKISEIVFFLLGAMVIVELIDVHQGFKVITNRITTKNNRSLLWIVAILTFFMSALLDNLTTAIVMVSVLKRLVHEDKQRKIFAGVVIIAANAGGAWSPIGDVTTTMLWNGGQLSTAKMFESLFIPSVLCTVVPLLILQFTLPRTQLAREAYDNQAAKQVEKVKGSKLMLFVGIGALIFVPVFKILTHLPPYVGMMLSLGVVWIVSEILHVNEEEEYKKNYTAAHALSRIDSSSVLFFLGILLAVSCLESTHILHHFASWLDVKVGNKDAIAILIGIASAIVDNVPLVAASQGMYDIQTYPMDSKIWQFLAFTAGTGGSILIIGSAAGVAVMGMEKIDFVWYVKKISWLAFIGFAVGCAAFLGLYALLN